MQTSEAGLHLIESFEGFSSVPYQDSVGVWTIGFGTTSADFSPLPQHCTRAQAEGWLRERLRTKYEPAVNALQASINQNQFDALVSLAYNCGPGAMSWQIGRDVHAGRLTAAADDFLHYVYAGGQVLQGLVNRRRAERALFLAPCKPPAPPKPVDPYAVFPDQAFRFGTHRYNERLTVKQVDGALKQRAKYRAYLKGPLRDRVKLLRDRCSAVAHRSTPAAWGDSRHLGQRWQRLNQRLKQIDSL